MVAVVRTLGACLGGVGCGGARRVQGRQEQATRWVAVKSRTTGKFRSLVRVDLNWRAVGLMEGKTMLWFWVGLHGECEALQ